MLSEKEQRAVLIGEYIIDTRCTIRQVAKVFGVSKSTAHRDVSKILSKIDPELHDEVQEVLNEHLDSRAHNGGHAYALQVLGNDKYIKRHILHEDAAYEYPKFKHSTIERLEAIVNYITDKKKTTAREIAKHFGMSKNNVYVYMKRLKLLDEELYNIVKPMIKVDLY